MITDFNIEVFCQNFNQLLTLKHIVEAGGDCRSYTNLHAKVLIIDDFSFATIGSQNFTNKAEKENYEENVSLNFEDIDSGFKERIRSLRISTSYQKITIDMIEAIFEECKKEFNERQIKLENIKQLQHEAISSKATIESVSLIQEDATANFKLKRINETRSAGLGIDGLGSFTGLGAKKSSNYLLYNTRSHELGFVRLGAKSFSLISKALHQSELSNDFDEIFKYDIDFKPYQIDNKLYNVCLKFYVKVGFWQVPSEFNIYLFYNLINCITVKTQKTGPFNWSYIEDMFFDETGFFKERELLKLLKPFKYKSPYKAPGGPIKDFIRDYDYSSFQISLIKRDNRLLFALI